MKMRKCKDCKQYTFKEVCPICKGETFFPSPSPYSPQDKYGKYRRSLRQTI